MAISIPKRWKKSQSKHVFRRHELVHTTSQQLPSHNWSATNSPALGLAHAVVSTERKRMGMGITRKRSQVVPEIGRNFGGIFKRTYRTRYGYGSIPINTIFRGLFTSINPSYFDVHQGYKVLTHCHMSWYVMCFVLVMVVDSPGWRDEQHSRQSATENMAWMAQRRKWPNKTMSSLKLIKLISHSHGNHFFKPLWHWCRGLQLLSLSLALTFVPRSILALTLGLKGFCRSALEELGTLRVHPEF